MTDRVSFGTIWDLIQKNHTQNTNVLTPELLVAIFWEETFFANILQIPSGPAIGFGQVQPADSFWRVKADFGKTFTKDEVLGSKDKGVEIASLTLASLYKRNNQSRDAALNGYSGLFAKDNDTNMTDEQKKKWRDDRTLLMNGWKSCERQLVGLKLGTSPNLSDFGLKAKIRSALNASRPATDADYAVALP
jgi:hypothetical protein